MGLNTKFPWFIDIQCHKPFFVYCKNESPQKLGHDESMELLDHAKRIEWQGATIRVSLDRFDLEVWIASE